MANMITFLNNYTSFGYKVRPVTANVFFAAFERSEDPDEKRILMARILDELVASTEDLVMWLTAISTRTLATSEGGDIWERMLLIQISDKDAKSVLDKHDRYKSGKTLFASLQLPSFESISKVSKLDVAPLEAMANAVLKAIKVSKHNRTTDNAAAIRFHNKIKHGMVVMKIPEGILVRDMKKGGVRENRNIIVKVDATKATEFVNTIVTNASAIRVLTAFLLFEFSIYIQNRPQKLSKKELAFIDDIGKHAQFLKQKL